MNSENIVKNVISCIKMASQIKERLIKLFKAELDKLGLKQKVRFFIDSDSICVMTRFEEDALKLKNIKNTPFSYKEWSPGYDPEKKKHVQGIYTVIFDLRNKKQWLEHDLYDIIWNKLLKGKYLIKNKNGKYVIKKSVLEQILNDMSWPDDLIKDIKITLGLRKMYEINENE